MDESTTTSDWTRKQAMDFFGEKSLSKDLLSTWCTYALGKPSGEKGLKRTFNAGDILDLATLLDDQKPPASREILNQHRLRKEQASSISKNCLASLGTLFSAAVAGTPQPGDFSGALTESLRRMCRLAAEVLEARHCAIFLFVEPHWLEIVADSRADPDTSHTGKKLKVGSSRTARAFDTDRIVNLFGPELETEGSNLTGHLEGGRTSLLATPLRNRKGVRIGVFKAENKTPGKLDRPRPFTPDDEVKVSLIALNLMLVLEMNATLHMVTESLTRLQDQTGFRGVAQMVVSQTVRLTSADFGEVSEALHVSPDEFHLTVQAVAPKENKVQPSQIIPEPSVSSSVLKSGEAQFLTNVLDKECNRFYHLCNEDTRSEAAFPIVAGRRTLGVINLESAHVGDDGGMQEADRPTISLASRLLGEAIHTAALYDAILGEMQPGDDSLARRILGTVLANIARTSQLFAKGLGYRAEYRHGTLRAAAWLNCPEKPFSMQFDDDKFAAQFAASKALREVKPYFSRFPAGDPNVHQDGLEKFDIRGSLIAVPVVVATNPVPFVVGAVVVWTDDGRTLHPEEVRQEIPLLEGLTRLAISVPEPPEGR